MNSKLYWKIRSVLKTIQFKIRRFFYSFAHKSNRDYSFCVSLCKLVIRSVLTSIPLAAAFFVCDSLIIEHLTLPSISASLLVDYLIGSIGLAGVMFGLYNSSITAVYSSKYVNAPSTIRASFQTDRKTQNCTIFIITYIVLGLIIIAKIIITGNGSWATLAGSFIGTVGVVVAYRIASYRAYELSDPLKVGDDAYHEIYETITGPLIYEPYSSDYSFQVHCQKKCEKQISLLKDIFQYGILDTDERITSSSRGEFLNKNLILVSIYWEYKRKVSRESAWFKLVDKYKLWHLTSDYEVSTAIHTGTGLQPLKEHDYWWFEDEFFSINKRGVERLCKDSDFINLYKYILSIQHLCEPAVFSQEANYLTGQIAIINNQLKEIEYQAADKNEEANDLLVGIVDALALLYLETILSSSKFLRQLDIPEQCKNIKEAIKSSAEVEKISILRSSINIELYKKLKNEIYVEGTVVTPDWLIEEAIAKEIYIYINNLSNFIRESLDGFFQLGELFDEKGLDLQAAIIFIRFYEVESKLSRFVDLFKKREIELLHMKRNEEKQWDSSKIGELMGSLEEWKGKITPLLTKNASVVALKTWENRDDNPDMLGDCYNHIAEDAVEAIVNNDYRQFSIDYSCLTKLMIIYQEYIRSDFISKRDLYRIEYQFYMFTSPIIEWAQIGGLAILWGEFQADSNWGKVVRDSVKDIFSKDDRGITLATTFIEYAQKRNRFWFGIGQRGVLESEWNSRVANAIKRSSKYETDFENYHMQVKTDSKLFKSFCHSFDEFGFINDPSELFWVVCVNPLLPEIKRFKSKFSWEEALND